MRLLFRERETSEHTICLNSHSMTQDARRNTAESVQFMVLNVVNIEFQIIHHELRFLPPVAFWLFRQLRLVQSGFRVVSAMNKDLLLGRFGSSKPIALWTGLYRAPSNFLDHNLILNLICPLAFTFSYTFLAFVISSISLYQYEQDQVYHSSHKFT
ncbi:hypothetical protein AHF37_10517 [Paragonimus kellicotti]|nr:hypothetical protein AHF37_10517 [Paragonimus kellicotti]